MSLLPDSSESLTALVSLGEADMAQHLQAWDQAQAARLRHLTFQLVPSQLEVIEEAIELAGGILKKCVNSQAVYPLSEQHGLKARERGYTAHEEGKHWE